MLFARPEHLWWSISAALFAALALWVWRRRRRALRAWVDRRLQPRLAPRWGERSGRSVALLAGAALGVVLALSQPRWGEREEVVERRGVEIAFVLDTSLSMATRDVEPNRFWIAQTLVRKLVRSTAGHRVALVQMEGESVVQVPLTLDGAAVELLLDALRVASLPLPGTRFASALEQSLELFPEGDAAHPVIVVLSDGEDHGEEALEAQLVRLRDRGVVVHVIGVGTPEGKPLELPQQDPDAAVQYKRDAEGRVVVSRLMEETLQRLARETGGLYLRASSPAVEVGPVIEQIEAMETQSFGEQRIDRLAERFQWPLAAAVLLLCLHLALSPHGRPGEDLL